MKKFTYEMTIEATEQPQAEKKMTALVILAGKLSAHELERLAHIIQHDPVKTAMAKRYLKV